MVYDVTIRLNNAVRPSETTLYNGTSAIISTDGYYYDGAYDWIMSLLLALTKFSILPLF